MDMTSNPGAMAGRAAHIYSVSSADAAPVCVDSAMDIPSLRCYVAPDSTLLCSSYGLVVDTDNDCMSRHSPLKRSPRPKLSHKLIVINGTMPNPF